MNDFGTSVVVSWTTTPVSINYTLTQLRINKLKFFKKALLPKANKHQNFCSKVFTGTPHTHITHTLYTHYTTLRNNNRILSGWNETTCPLECNIVADIMFLSYFPRLSLFHAFLPSSACLILHTLAGAFVCCCVLKVAFDVLTHLLRFFPFFFC